MIDKGKRWSSRTVVLTMTTVALLGVTPFVAEANAAPAPAVQAAGTTVKGTVVDATGEPIIGASVMLKGTSKGAATDLDGNFTITNAPADGELTVSYIGYKPQTIKLDGRASYDFTLQEDNAMLEEVVVVGYGTQKKATMTGSVAVVGAEQLSNKGTLSSPVQALQGQVPGVIITRGSSAPGDESWGMKLRGAVSANGGDPLIIIDGVEYENVNELRLINPSDIESINFLKDASASIYGSKAAGGVVLVTTKKAKEGKVRVDYNGSYTYKHIGLSAELMSLDQWADAVIQARTNDGMGSDDKWLRYAKAARTYRNQYIDLRYSPDIIGLGDIADYTFFDTDWQDILWGDSWSTQHELAISGGKEGNTFRLSLGYMHDASNLKWGNNNNNRFNLRLSNSMKLNEHFSIESVIAYNRQDQVAPTQIGQCLTSASQQPGFPSSTKDGKPYGWGSSKWGAPNWFAELGGDNKLKVSAVNISETLRYKIIDGLQAVAVLGYNSSYSTRDTKSKSVEFYNYAGDVKQWDKPNQEDSYYVASNSNTDFYSVQAYLEWSKTFAHDHDVKLMGGYQYNLKQYNYTITKALNILPSLEIINGQGEVSIKDGNSKPNKWEEALMSYYGRANYAYKSKYMIEGQFRYDGSSKFKKENRWSFFWGTSLGWRISQEKFMGWSRGFLDDLKIRASYGEVGNQSGIEFYDGTMLYNFNPTSSTLIGGSLVSYIDTSGRLPSNNRTWERIKNYNVAVDFSFFNNRLSGTVEAFRKKVDNMLIEVNYPKILGDKADKGNYGAFKAWGYEGNITWRDRIGNVTYHIGGTFTYADNELTNRGGSAAVGAGVKSDREGYPLNSVWGFRYCGKIQNEEQREKYVNRYADTYVGEGNINLVRLGDNMYEDVNHDGKLDANDIVYLGTDDPKIQFSLNFGIEWKGFDLSCVFQGAGKRTIWRQDGNNNIKDIWSVPQRAVYQNGSNIFIGKVWSPENPNGEFPTLTNNQEINKYNYQCSSWSVEDGSYLRLKNLTVGYTLPSHLIQKTKVLSSLRVYVTGTDLWEISHINDGWDPEARRKVTNASRYPFLRTVTFGANISF